MCSSSNGSQNCCPPAQFFQESHCGNFEGETFHGYWGGENTIEEDPVYVHFVKDLENTIEYRDILDGESEGLEDLVDFKRKEGYVYPRKVMAWRAPLTKSDYVQGTFEIFNSSHSRYPVFALVDGAVLIVEPGNSEIVSVHRPKRFLIFAFGKTDGKFCVTLYKRILA